MRVDRRTPGVLRVWTPVALYMAAIFLSSSVPVPPEAAGLVPDKLVHALLYAGLTLLVARALAGGLRRAIGGPTAVAAVAIAAAYGISDEIHQAFVPTRQPDAADVVADVAGSVVAAASLWIWTLRTFGRGDAARRESTRP